MVDSDDDDDQDGAAGWDDADGGLAYDMAQVVRSEKEWSKKHVDNSIRGCNAVDSMSTLG